MRVAEMKLLYADSLAYTGDLQRAKTELKDFMTLRLKIDATKTAYNTRIDGLLEKDMKDEIYLHTRIEFVGEGKSYLAMKRNKTRIKYPSNHLYFAGNEFEYNDPHLTFLIPQIEYQNNSNIKN